MTRGNVTDPQKHPVARCGCLEIVCGCSSLGRLRFAFHFLHLLQAVHADLHYPRVALHHPWHVVVLHHCR